MAYRRYRAFTIIVILKSCKQRIIVSIAPFIPAAHVYYHSLSFVLLVVWFSSAY